MPELNQQTILRETVVPRVTTDASLEYSYEGVRLLNDESSPGSNMVYGTDDEGVRGWQTGYIPSSTIVSITGTTTLTVTAFGKTHECSGTSSNYTITLPTAASNAGKEIAFKILPGMTKLVTIDGLDSETIDGETVKILWEKEYLQIYSNGTNWLVRSYEFRAMTAGLYIDSVSIAEDTAIKVLFTAEMYDNTGMMNDVANHQINVLRNSSWMVYGAAYPIATTAIPLFTVQTRVDGVQITGIAGARGGNTSGRSDQLNGNSRPVEINAGSVVDLQIFQSIAAANFWARLYLLEVKA